MQECSVTGRKFTFDDIRIKSRNFNSALRKKLDLKQKNVVGILLPNLPEYPIVTLGILQAGLICTTLNPIYTSGSIIKNNDLHTFYV